MSQKLVRQRAAAEKVVKEVSLSDVPMMCAISCQSISRHATKMITPAMPATGTIENSGAT